MTSIFDMLPLIYIAKTEMFLPDFLIADVQRDWMAHVEIIKSAKTLVSAFDISTLWQGSLKMLQSLANPHKHMVRFC